MQSCKVKILLVDDSEDFCDLFRYYVQIPNSQYMIAHSVEEAKSMVKDADCMILDLKLPDGNGKDFLRQLRKEGNRIPVIIVTGNPHMMSSQDIKELNTFDFIQKPLSWDSRLQRRVENLVLYPRHINLLKQLGSYVTNRKS